VASEIQKVRRTGLTFAPEAGTWRLRQVINKLIREEDLYGAVESAYSQGWRRVKLYFMTGLPTEIDEDTLGVARLARNCVEIGRRYTKSASVTASVGGFVPKPHTPFQWFGQNGVAELQRKIGLLRDDLRRTRAVQLRWHDPKATLAEGIASRGDRRIGAVIEDVWRQGGRFQEWTEHFDLSLWQDAMARHGLSVDWYVTRHRREDEPLPWDHISARLHRDFPRMWERACRRVRVPLAYTGGFSPRPKVSFGLALPTGHESQAEYLDFEVQEGATVEVDGLPARLSPALPTGVDAVAAAAVD